MTTGVLPPVLLPVNAHADLDTSGAFLPRLGRADASAGRRAANHVVARVE